MNVLFAAETALIRVLLAALRPLRPETASDLGGFVARRVGPHLPVSRVAHANLSRAMPELDAAARKRVVRGVWDNLGRTVAEWPHLARVERDTPSGPGYTIEGAEHVLAAVARGGPILFVGGHIGNWEMLPRAAAALGAPMSSFYRAPPNPELERIINALRRDAAGVEVPMFRKGAEGAKQALGHLIRRGTLGLLVDQKLNDGVEARLFGLPAMTAPAAAAFGLRFRCPIIMGHVIRVGPARFRVVAEPPLALPDTGDRAADILALTQTINDGLERWIRAHPESWLWLHRRWPKDVVKTG